MTIVAQVVRDEILRYRQEGVFITLEEIIALTITDSINLKWIIFYEWKLCNENNKLLFPKNILCKVSGRKLQVATKVGHYQRKGIFGNAIYRSNIYSKSSRHFADETIRTSSTSVGKYFIFLVSVLSQFTVLLFCSLFRKVLKFLFLVCFLCKFCLSSRYFDFLFIGQFT